ncbi:MAG TPA: isocitrate lyase/phosphoenolpyruvate mutase family protein [Gemmatimonadaceae bacterium]
MDRATQRHRAEIFRQLHHGEHILVLPNAWDVATARVFQAAGFPAVATTSAGIANALGYPDGERISREEMVAMVERIAHHLDVPLTADMEAGYTDTLQGLEETARLVVTAGAVGLNLEDATGGEESPLYDIELAADRVRAVRDAAAAAGVPLVINARTDVFLGQVGEPSTRLAHAIKRANAYRAAGADCLFVPGVRDAETIRTLASEIDGPINILAGPGAPSAPELERLGVARVSVGSGPARAALGLVQRIARELAERGTYESFTTGAITYAEANALVS